ncbi:conserved exported hypothetical protein [Candidatus Zixiibacteriota bacterium]|nr:conserved exported hypothetical protein [candidate division Zixibacteria bacterium]
MHFWLKPVSIIVGLALFISPLAGAQQEPPARSLFDIPARTLINCPTANTLPRGCFDVILRVYPNGGILSGTNIGLSNRFMVGLSYGAEGIIAEHNPTWNPRIEFNVKLKLIEEQPYFPAFTLGFCSQGQGSYNKEWKRYTYKSKGFYGVISRTLYFYRSSFGGHFGLNYSFENEKDNDKSPDLFFGFDTQINYNIAFNMEYDAGLNDDASSAPFGRGRGYLNMSIRWLFSENLELEAIFDNLLNNRRDANSFGRGLRFTYIEFF